jgi:hypothetical protein
VLNRSILATFGVLSMARRIAPQIEICTIAPKAGIVRLSNGLEVIAQFGMQDAPACDICHRDGRSGLGRSVAIFRNAGVHSTRPCIEQDRVGMYGSR